MTDEKMTPAGLEEPGGISDAPGDTEQGAGDAARYEKSDRAAQKRSRTIRLGVLIAGLVLITGMGYIHQTGALFKIVGVDALCPFGGLETLWSVIAGGELIKKVAWSSVILFGITIATAVVLRRSFCGYICPLGALQELFGKIGKAIWRKGRPTVPAALDKYARYLKYVVLAVFTVWTWQAAELVIRPYDPWATYMHITSAEIFTEFAIGFIVLAVSLIGSIVYERFFCKYLCPMGGLLGAISRFSLFKVRRNESTCIDCKACDKACPVNITVSEAAPVVHDAECINCNECVNACPVKGALEVSTSGSGAASDPGSHRTVLTPNRVLALMVAIIGGILVVTTVAGAFEWEQKGLKAAPTVTDEPSGDTAPATGSTVPDVNVEDIKGSTTLDEVIAATTIPFSAFQEKWGIQESERGEKIKDLSAKYGFDVHEGFRDFVAEQLDAMRAGETTSGSADEEVIDMTGTGEEATD